jgi:hypothetical protein
MDADVMKRTIPPARYASNSGNNWARRRHERATDREQLLELFKPRAKVGEMDQASF